MNSLLIYLVIINAVSFGLMRADKQKARKNAWRIPERTLLIIAAAGGSLGALAAMQLFRHKTKHLKFAIGIPLMLAVHVLMIVVFITKTA